MTVTKYRLTFRSGLVDEQLFNTEDAAYLQARKRFFGLGPYSLEGGKIWWEGVEEPVATIEAVQQCPLEVIGTQEEWFILTQPFLVYFKDGGFDGVKKMYLEDIVEMVDTFQAVSYPRDVYLDEFHYDTVSSADELCSYFTAWKIPYNWEQPPYFPIYAHIGYFPDWDSGEFEEEED